MKKTVIRVSIFGIFLSVCQIGYSAPLDERVSYACNIVAKHSKVGFDAKNKYKDETDLQKALNEKEIMPLDKMAVVEGYLAINYQDAFNTSFNKCLNWKGAEK